MDSQVQQSTTHLIAQAGMLFNMKLQALMTACHTLWLRAVITTIPGHRALGQKRDSGIIQLSQLIAKIHQPVKAMLQTMLLLQDIQQELTRITLKSSPLLETAMLFTVRGMKMVNSGTVTHVMFATENSFKMVPMLTSQQHHSLT